MQPESKSDRLDLLVTAWGILHLCGYNINQFGIFIYQDVELHIEMTIDGKQHSFRLFAGNKHLSFDEVIAGCGVRMTDWNSLTPDEMYMRIANSPALPLVLDFLRGLLWKGIKLPFMVDNTFTALCPFCTVPVFYDFASQKVVHDLPMCKMYATAKDGKEYVSWASDLVLERLKRFGNLKSSPASGDN
jgi:hypothetical protein